METKINTKINTKIKCLVPLGALSNLKSPTAFTSSFTVDTILGQLNWTNNAGDDAQFEVYSSTNGAADVLLTTTAANATSYQDTTCKQNASVVYKIRAKKGTKFSDLVAASTLATPLCWKTNQSVLTAVVISQLTIDAGKSVTVNWGDGTSQAYSGDNLNITKNYAIAGQYNIWISGDVNFITVIKNGSQIKTYGVITNWILPSTITNFQFHLTSITGSISNWVLPSNIAYLLLYSTSITGNISNWVLPASMIFLRLYSTAISGSLPTMTKNEANVMDYQLQSCSFSDSNATVFRKAMTIFNISNQNVTFPTANIDKLLKAAADWYQVNAPTANCTFTMNGANMGIPTGGAANADIARLIGYYTAAAKTATVIVRTS